ncbi:hypothetical protein [Kitasatospora griseola]
MAGWLDLALRIAVEDLAGELPDVRRMVFSQARCDGRVMLKYWKEQRCSPPA